METRLLVVGRRVVEVVVLERIGAKSLVKFPTRPDPVLVPTAALREDDRHRDTMT